MEETMVPLNDDTPRMAKRSDSFGSDKDIDLHEEGEENTLEYRVHAKHGGDGGDKGKTISLWHDISLVHIDPESGKKTDCLNFVCEIPKFTR
ncbi:MAG: inorganic pyrophosphatase [Bacillariaceae sp.]|jgi:inorganic pyrophosphatase